MNRDRQKIGTGRWTERQYQDRELERKSSGRQWDRRERRKKKGREINKKS